MPGEVVVVVVEEEPLETLIRTFVPRSTCSPAAGSWAVTVPSASDEGTVTAFATSPASARADSASARLRPTTSGTVVRPRPFETSIVTVSPFCAFVPGCGLCATTIPRFFFAKTCRSSGTSPAETRRCFALSVWRPTTSGTRSRAGAFETAIWTRSPFSSFVPACGSWPKTVPRGRSLARRRTRATRPRSLRRLTASGSCNPTTRGTLTLSPPPRVRK